MKSLIERVTKLTGWEWQELQHFSVGEGTDLIFTSADASWRNGVSDFPNQIRQKSFNSIYGRKCHDFRITDNAMHSIMLAMTDHCF